MARSLFLRQQHGLKRPYQESTEMSDFNADDFMNETIDAPLETEIKLVPEGEYRAMIDDFPNDAIQRVDFEYKRGPNVGQPGSMLKFSCPFVIKDDPKVQQALNRDVVKVYKELVLDVDENTKKLDFGVNRNVELGKIRDAVGQNVPGPWGIGRLKNAGPVMVKVVHRTYDRKDGSKGKRAEVDRVIAIR